VRASGWVFAVVLAWAGLLAVGKARADTLCLDSAHNVVPCPAPTSPPATPTPATTAAPTPATTAAPAPATTAPPETPGTTLPATTPTAGAQPPPTGPPATAVPPNGSPPPPTTRLPKTATRPTPRESPLLGGWPTVVIVGLVVILAAALVTVRVEWARTGRYQARRNRPSGRSRR
jgi:hypothetical protein